MIWFFLAGWISGAVFMVLYANFWIRKHARKVSPDELLREIDENEEEKSHE